MEAPRVLERITVVIATLGGPTLSRTINILNRGTVVPDEILVCIPAEDAHKAAALDAPNVKVVATDCRGQVAQRAIGFQSAAHEVVMQLDDDLLADERCIEYLLEVLTRRGGKTAVAPALIDIATGASVYKRPERHPWLESTYQWLMNGSAGYEEGRIQKCGSAIGVDPKPGRQLAYQVEWLPGGCVMHFKRNLVLENFYPFQGKAYCEDIIHSYHLSRSGVSLFVEPRAVCGLDDPPASTPSPAEFLRSLRADWRARSYFMRLSVRGSLRMYFFYMATCLSYALKKVGAPFATKRGRARST